MTLTLRKVRPDDWRFILSVRNQDSVRIMCHDVNMISWESHQKYMQKIKDQPQWIVEYDHIPIGHCKIIDGEFGFMILKECEGRSIGLMIYDLVFQECKKLGIKKLKDVCKIENKASIFIAKLAGFNAVDQIFRDEKPYAVVLEKEL